MMKVKLFVTPACPKCKLIRDFIALAGMDADIIDCATPEGLNLARKLSVSTIPTIIFDDGRKANTLEEIKKILENKKLKWD